MNFHSHMINLEWTGKGGGGFLVVESIAEEDAMKIVEVITKEFRNLAGKAVASFETIESNFEKVLLWIKDRQTALHTAEKTVHGMNRPRGRFPCLILIGKPPQLTCQELSASRQDASLAKTIKLPEAQVTINIFFSNNKVF